MWLFNRKVTSEQFEYYPKPFDSEVMYPYPPREVVRVGFFGGFFQTRESKREMMEFRFRVAEWTIAREEKS